MRRQVLRPPVRALSATVPGAEPRLEAAVGRVPSGSWEASSRDNLEVWLPRTGPYPSWGAAGLVGGGGGLPLQGGLGTRDDAWRIEEFETAPGLCPRPQRRRGHKPSPARTGRTSRRHWYVHWYSTEPRNLGRN